MRKHTYHIVYVGDPKLHQVIASSVIEAVIHGLSYTYEFPNPKDIQYVIDAETGELFNEINWNVTANKKKG